VSERPSTNGEDDRDFTPAAPQLWLYDLLVALLTRESRWRGALMAQIQPDSEDAIADVGCGTGTMLARIGKAAPSAKLIGIDPDPEIVERARLKTAGAGANVEFMHGYARESADLLDGIAINKIISSLVFHQVPLEEKRAGLAAMREALAPGGELHLADYGLQRTPLMRRLFRIVQNADGFENTEPNALGVLPELMEEVGFEDVEETVVIPTPTGSISIYHAKRGA
jgi:ubiquinone/menaquinone biosynthesis C-methylase UbiE